MMTSALAMRILHRFRRPLVQHWRGMLCSMRLYDPVARLLSVRVRAQSVETKGQVEGENEAERVIRPLLARRRNG